MSKKKNRKKRTHVNKYEGMGEKRKKPKASPSNGGNDSMKSNPPPVAQTPAPSAPSSKAPKPTRKPPAAVPSKPPAVHTPRPSGSPAVFASESFDDFVS